MMNDEPPQKKAKVEGVTPGEEKINPLTTKPYSKRYFEIFEKRRRSHLDSAALR
jgi:hypothetical protein